MSEECQDKVTENEILPSCKEIKEEKDGELKTTISGNLNESLDELKCIQQEIEVLKQETDSKSVPTEMKDVKLLENSDLGSDVKSTESIERESLIEMLTADEASVANTKGTIINTDNLQIISQPLAQETITPDIPEDVEIEGEGSFQIMDVVYDDEFADPIAPSQMVTKTLTPEEERAIAMQQIADLNVKPRGGRSKQENTNKSSNLTAVTGVEGIYQDQAIGIEKILPKKKEPTVSMKNNSDNLKKIEKVKAPIVTNVVVVPGNQKNNAVTEIKKEKLEVPKQEPPAPLQTTGVKRIIKRRIIWDPDAPETAISYAQLARSKGRTVITDQPVTAIKAPEQIVRKDSIIKKVQVTVPKDKPATTVKAQIINIGKTPTTIGKPTTTAVKAINSNVRSTTPGAVISVGPTAACTNKVNTVVSKTPTVVKVAVARKRAQTPVANGASGAKKKKVSSEIERLMNDEGAANMLNDVKRTENTESSAESPKTSGRSRLADKTSKQAGAPAKKDSPSLPRGRRGPKPKTSQWDSVYKHKAGDDAMIIRRRSNSSYSSNASAHRSSIDSELSTPNHTTENSTLANNDSIDANEIIDKNETGSGNNASTSAKTPSNISVTEENATGSVTNAIKGKHILVKSTKAPLATSTPATIAAPRNTNRKNFEFVKPENKNEIHQQPQGINTAGTRRTKQMVAKREGQIVLVTKGNSKEDHNETDNKGDFNKEQNIICKKSECIAHIDVNIKSHKPQFQFALKTLSSLTEHIMAFSKDRGIYSLTIAFNYGNFWKSFELSTLLNEEPDKTRHKHIIMEWTSAVRAYLSALATFPKPLIAALHGNFFGLGVVQLVLFDTIIVEENTTFETHYVDLNMIPMGFTFWQYAPNINNVLFKKLFWFGERVTSEEAHLLGFVYKIVPPNHLAYEALVHAEYMTSIHSIMKRKVVRERSEILASTFHAEITAIVEKFSKRNSSN